MYAYCNGIRLIWSCKITWLQLDQLVNVRKHVAAGVTMMEAEI